MRSNKWFIIICFIFLIIISCIDKGKFREGNMTAFTAKKLIERKYPSLSKKSSLIMVVAGFFVLWKERYRGLYYTVPSWIFVFRDLKKITKTISIEVKIQKSKDGNLMINSKIEK